MTEYHNESLSALMDGECDELELRRILRSMPDHPELAQRWQRYHLAQSVLHDRGMAVSPGLAAAVTAALANEPPISRQLDAALPSVSRPRWQWPQQLARLAVAASVALVVMLVLQPDTNAPQPSSGLAQQASPDTSDPAPVEPATPATTLVADTPRTAVDPQARQRLREYIEAMRFDPEEPVRIEHLQDSPLYRLVNQIQTQP